MYLGVAVVTNQYVKCVSQNHGEGSQVLHSSQMRMGVLIHSAVHHMILILGDAVQR
jgi:hypothetical protein